MTPKQEAYAKRLRAGIMTIARGRLGWNNDDAHAYFAAWGYGESLRALSIQDLRMLQSTLEQQVNDTQKANAPKRQKPGKVMPEMAPRHKQGPGLATKKQVLYAGILAQRYAELQGIPQEHAFEAWHRFAHNKIGIDNVAWCTRKEATKVLTIMEKVFIDKFGADEFEALKGEPYRTTNQQPKTRRA